MSLASVVSQPANWTERLNETQFAYLMLVPVFLLLGVIAIWPLLSTFRMSLFADNLTSAATVGEFVGLQNYVELLSGQREPVLPRPFFDISQPFRSALLVTLIFAVVSVLLETLLGFAAALVLDQEFRGRRWFRVALILPWAVPIVIQGMIFYLMFAPGIGFATDPLNNLGIFGATPLTNSFDSLVIIVIADVWKTTAFMTLLILAGLQSIDRSLYEVGRVSGASKWQQFKMITLPLVLPAVLVAMLFRSINAMRVFGLIETVSDCGTVPSLSCMVVQTFSSGRYGTSAAIAFLTAAIIGGAVMIYIVQFARGQAEVI
ncbi:carbohydrate ABC transporter permease [Natronoarchaeum rubrum]|uniref:carbohydrate ABC transporter permease n=1 Tax=Natronoarchaeum rubrum TaxID=755311 RepID=UPI002111B656|nr:sugar ABC transporter permease [Natronoarchaeum rubrum]HMB49809.1 sugar ABC transporter permease [Natronoarchaeum rubrum]